MTSLSLREVDVREHGGADAYRWARHHGLTGTFVVGLPATRGRRSRVPCHRLSTRDCRAPGRRRNPSCGFVGAMPETLRLLRRCGHACVGCCARRRHSLADGIEDLRNDKAATPLGVAAIVSSTEHERSGDRPAQIPFAVIVTQLVDSEPPRHRTRMIARPVLTGPMNT